MFGLTGRQIKGGERKKEKKSALPDTKIWRKASSDFRRTLMLSIRFTYVVRAPRINVDTSASGTSGSASGCALLLDPTQHAPDVHALPLVYMQN